MKEFLLIIISLLVLASCQNPVEEIEERGIERTAAAQPYHSPISETTVETESRVPIDIHLSYGRAWWSTYDVELNFRAGPYKTKDNRWWGPILIRPILIQVKNIDTNSAYYGKKYTVVERPSITFSQKYDFTYAYCSKSLTLPQRYQITSVRLQVHENYWDSWSTSPASFVELCVLGVWDNQAKIIDLPSIHFLSGFPPAIDYSQLP